MDWKKNVRKNGLEMYEKCTENWTEIDEIWMLFSMEK